jgi:FkbM family methyltransferase
VTETERPHGYYSQPAWCRLLIAACQKLPLHTWLGKRLAFILRKPVLMRKQSPVDAIVEGLELRLFPRRNLSDKRLLCTPELLDGRERAFFVTALAPQSTVLDIGANIGGFGLLLAAKREDLRLLCVEADPGLAKRVSQHIAFNSMQERCQCIEAAAAPDDGLVSLYLDDVNQGRNSLVEGGEHPESVSGSISVQGLTLNSIISQYQVSKLGLLKMDIEGFEFPVLERFFEQADKSVWPEFIQLEQDRKATDNQAVELAVKHGYTKVRQTRMNIILQRDS